GFGSSATRASATPKTVASAGHFTAEFGTRSVLRRLVGTDGVKVVDNSSGQAEKVTTSDNMEANFAMGGGIENLVQTGNFVYRETGSSPGADPLREAFAAEARFSAADDTLILSGSPRVIQSGMTVAAQNIRLVRHTGEAFAD